MEHILNSDLSLSDLSFTWEDKSYVSKDVITLEFERAKTKRRRNARLEKKNKSLESLCKRGRGWSFSYSMSLNA
jgi:hypothetical protein